MRKVITVLVLAGAVSLVGCNKNKKTTAKTPPPPPAADTYSGGTTPSPAPAPVYEPVPVAPAPAPEPVTVNAKTYTVKKGDTMSKIAREQLGGINQLGPLIRANPGMDPNKIKPGQVLNLP